MRLVNTRETISEAAIIPATNLSHYLPRLLDLGLVERRIPTTVPLEKRNFSRISRYFLRDQYLRFYYRFVDPNLHLIEQGLSQRLWALMGWWHGLPSMSHMFQRRFAGSHVTAIYDCRLQLRQRYLDFVIMHHRCPVEGVGRGMTHTG